MQSYSKLFAYIYNQRWSLFSISLAPKIYSLFQTKIESAKLKKTLLDLCCGTGQFSRFFLDRGYFVYGVDISPYMVAYAKENNNQYIHENKAQFSVQDARSFSIEGTISFIVSVYDSLNHLPSMNDLQLCFSRAIQFLDFGGILLFDLNTRKGLYRWNNISVQDDDDLTIVNRGVFSLEMSHAYTQFTGFVKNDSGSYEKFVETIYSTVYKISEVTDVLTRIGFRSVYVASSEDLTKKITNPEEMTRAFIIAVK